MAEVIAFVGGIATVSQLLVYFGQITRHSISFYNSFTEAPRVLGQMKERLDILQQIIEQVQSYTNEYDDSDLLPTGTKELLLQSANRIQASLNEAELKCEVAAKGNVKKKMKRVIWVLRDEPALNRLLQDLNDSDRLLHLVMQLMTMKTNLLASRQQSALVRKTCSTDKKAKIDKPVANTRSDLMMYAWPWLRQLGFYGTINTKSYSQCLVDADISLGYRFPTWLWQKSIDFQLQVQIPRCIGMQNRVVADSPFMVACRQGDIDRIRQCLADGLGSVNDRLNCTGETPLMLSIESGNIHAIKVLLGEGANPNIGDDNGITPIFFALGMNPRKNKPFHQLPPRNPMWVDIIRLLTEHDASVHDTINGYSITTLNLVWHKGTIRTLEFFHFLQDQCYVDFDAEMVGAWSAFTSALRSRETTLQCLEFLKARGLDFSKIFTDGRSLLHCGAELVHEPEVMEYLCEICPPHHINRQDDLGWTPLHYALAFEILRMPEDSLAKVEILARHGADPSITARHFPLVNIDKEQYTAFELSESLKSDQYAQFLAIMRKSGHEIPEEAERNLFYDTVASEPIS